MRLIGLAVVLTLWMLSKREGRDIQTCVTRRRMRHDIANIKKWKTSRLRFVIAVPRYTDRALCVTRII